MKKDTKIKVLKGSVNEAHAETYGFEIVDPKDAVVVVTVSSNVRQIGQTRIARITEEALKLAGYNNVNFVADTKFMYDYSRKMVIDNNNNNNMPNLRIEVIDKDLTKSIKLEDIDFDNENSIKNLQTDKVEVSIEFLKYLINHCYTGAEEPDSLNERVKRIISEITN